MDVSPLLTPPFCSKYAYSDESVIVMYRRCEACKGIYEAPEANVSAAELHMCPGLILSARKDPCQHSQQNRLAKPGSLRDLKTLPASSYSSLLPYQSPQVEEILRRIHPEPPKVLVDATCHIGGDTLNFARMYPDAVIHAIDIDANAVACLRVNILRASKNEAFGKVTVICADCTKYIPEARIAADMYYIDPPWYGPSYAKRNEVFLFLGGENVVVLVNKILELGLSRSVLLKVPRNFAYADFELAVHGNTERFYIKKPQKKGSVAYGLILIRAR